MSEHNVDDVSVFGSTFADQELDLTGNLPVVVSHKPNTLSATWAAANPALVAARPTTSISATSACSSGARRWTTSRKARAKNTRCAPISPTTSTTNSFIRRVKGGVRYADRDQDVRYTTYNWGALSEVWSGTAGVAGAGRRRPGRVLRLPRLLPRPDAGPDPAAITTLAT